ncbi:histone acetyltransferase SAS3 [Sporothrix schenckii 1099-18]|uniref:Histone acetyltransferase n=1 Tax=Sporothrix schenckii 1099-18 TaxID=1397361 RepID=A0A0F2M352_SPOSC|nr:histone acetyltransferase SAS3 [Sporothrix schenckii 1099-18]KJR83195.1 histone acetyltransferase SAS3 [Sporothrix schenckii 1099-18]
MASEQLIQEELQSSAAVSEPSGSSHMDDDESTGTLDRAAQLGMTNGMKSDASAGDGERYTGEESEELEEEEDAEGEEDDEFHDDADDYESDGAGEDVEDELDEDDTILPTAAGRRRLRVKDDDGEDDEEEGDEDDAEGEDDSEGGRDEEEASDDDAVGDAEGVGAVKIRPGETEDDEDESEASAASEESSDEEWEEQAQNADDDDDEDEDVEEEEEEEEVGDEDEGASQVGAAAEHVYDDDEEDEDGAAFNYHLDCLYCRRGYGKPRKSDPNLWTCPTCTNRAHVECSYQHQAPDGFTAEEPWQCPDCVAKNRTEAGDAAVETMDVDGNGTLQTTNGADVVNGTPPKTAIHATRKANTPRSSPALRGLGANTGSVSEDQTDGAPRSLRKRRTSPVESVGSGMSLRKRRKNVTADLSIDGFTDIHNSTVPNSARSLRIKPPAASQVSVVKKTRGSLILKIKVAPADLRRITVKKRKYTKRGTAPPRISKKEKKRLEQLAAENGLSVGSDALPVMPSTTAYTQPFYSFFDKDTDEQKGKPYGGILTEAEADTSKTFPTPDDRRRFDDAKQKAEEEWRARLLVMQAEAEATQPPKKKKAAGPASQIECIEFGGWEIDTWYAAPYPEEYSRNRVLYICEFCLKYMNSDYVAWRHKLKCPAKHPPGDEIYRHESISFFEVDGRKNPVYCQNLCLLAKLFLGSKTLYYDVEPFLFYVLCEYDEFGYHFVGYFSKEKRASSQNNVSCILTLPIHQRKGYGNLLIDFSYLLTRVEEKTGSPEKPLSDMGLVSYRNYWRLVMCRYLLDAMTASRGAKLGLSIKQISNDTGMTADDVISALEGLRCLVRDPQTGLYAFRVDVTYCREYVAKWESKKYVTLNPAALTWTPYVMGRGNATNFELGPALTAIAPREEDEEPKSGERFVACLANSDSISTQGGLTNGVAADAAATTATTEDSKALASSATVLESTEPNDKDGIVPETKDEADTKTNGDHSAASAATSSKTLGADGDADADADADIEPPVANIMSDIKSEDKDDDDSEGDDVVGSKSRATTALNGMATHAAHEHHGAAPAPSVAGTANGSQKQDDSGNGGDWAAAYSSVPTTRFVVFPPVSARRLSSYPRAPIGRPPGARTGSGNRARSRHSTTGHVRRAVVSTSRPKAPSSSKKKTGGTGRGPGRWPKGTKKSDYGNADSGPGLPPAWLARKIAAAESHKAGSGSGSGSSSGDAVNGGPKHEGEAHDATASAAADDAHPAPPITPSRQSAASSDHDDDDDDEADAEGEDDDEHTVADTVQVHTPTLPTRLADKRGGVNGAVLASGTRGRSSPRLGKIKAAALHDGGEADTVMVDVGET